MTRHPVRVLLRLTAFCAAGLLALLDFVWNVKRREKGLNYPGRALWAQRWGRNFLTILGVKVSFRGSPPVRGVLACNHLSYLDIAVLATIHPMIFVSKSEVRSWPGIGWLTRCAGTLYLNRAKKGQVKTLADDFEKVVGQQSVLALFPEGTSSDGAKVLPFYSSLFEPPARLGWPATGGWISYSLRDGSVADEVCYWRDMTFFPHFLNLMSKDSVHATVVFGEPLTETMDRKEMAGALWTQVSQLAASGMAPSAAGPDEMGGDLNGATAMPETRAYL